ncbi:hypothetical protein [Sedimentibacter sp.]|uniref:hypothetical protein n=1 Tax=Sedimentibacter sp. TaxID=1960295 RepID=UPI00289DA38B|nr:hypothetical protein [Sedimentibacter sp.]
MSLKLNNKRKGSALAFVLVGFLIISIIGSSILFIFNTNLKQAKGQQDSLEAYYLAYSGAEMAYSSLLTKTGSKYKYEEITKDGKTLTENNIVYGNGKINVVAKKSNNDDFKDWIVITSTSTLDRNGVTYTRKLYFDPENHVDMIWIN